MQPSIFLNVLVDTYVYIFLEMYFLPFKILGEVNDSRKEAS
jgi:hypothetical protein